jgi:hypothetical protein
MSAPIDLTVARVTAEQALAAAKKQGLPDARITTGALVYLWLLDMAEIGLMSQMHDGDA